MPLISRMSVHNLLEWVLQATAAGQLHDSAAGAVSVAVVTHIPTDIRVREAVRATQSADDEGPTAEDRAWVARGRELLSADIGSPLADFPAMLSVSSAKELALREQGCG